MNEVRQLAQELSSDPVRFANHVPKLLLLVKPDKPKDVVVAAIKALDSYFVDFLDSWSSQSSGQDDQAAAVFRDWGNKQFNTFTTTLLQLLESQTEHAAVQVAALSSLMEGVRVQPVGKFSNKLFARLVQTLLTAAHVHAQVFNIFFSKYLPCADVRYYTLHTLRRTAARMADTHLGGEQKIKADGKADRDDGENDDDPSPSGQCPPEDVARNMYDMLAHVEAKWSADDDGDIRSWCLAAEAGTVKAAQTAHLSAKARRKKRKLEQDVSTWKQQSSQESAAWANAVMQKKMFSEAWLAFLRLPVPEDIYRKVLTQIHSTVIPNITNPLLLSDFLTNALDKGGLLGVLALNGIFLLVTQHGLEYPQFYTRLYGLMKGDVFLSKHRAQFFQLVDVFLSSPLVPAYTAASFAKRFARLALTAPPAGAMTAIAFIHNLIRRHPACMIMMHKPLSAQQAAGASGEDVFNDEEDDPANTRAVESSLWELIALRNHYAPQVSAFTTILNKDLTNRVRTSEVELEPLLAASYSSMIKEAVDKKLKNVAVAFYEQAPTKLFGANCVEDFAGWIVNTDAAAA